MNIMHYSIRSFFTNEYYSIIRFASKRLFVATLLHCTVLHCTVLCCTVLYCTVLYQQVEQVVAVSMSGLVQIYQPSNHAEVTLRPMLLRFKQDVFTISMRMGPERFIWLKIIARKKMSFFMCHVY